jgi:hypothetical protein
MNTIIPLINQLEISAEERDLTIQKVNAILHTHQTQQFDREIMKRFFKEWKFIAERVKAGGEMLDRSFAIGKENDKNHLGKLNDLYVLQLQLLGFYEMIFKEALPEEDFENTLNSIFVAVV